MKKIMLSCLVALAAFAASAQAQNDRENGRRQPSQEELTKMLSKRVEQTTKQLKLEGTQKEQFTTLYTEYLTKEMALRQDNNKNGDKKTDKKELTEDEAAARIEKNLTQEEQQLNLKKEYYKKMRDAGLPATKLVNIFSRQPFGGRGGNRSGQNNNRQGGFGGPMGGGFGGPGGGFGGPMD